MNLTKIQKLLKSRQFWVFVGIFAVNGVSGVQDVIPANMMVPTNGFLLLMAIYFRISPKQNFK